MKFPCKKFIPILAAVLVAAMAVADDLSDFKKWYMSAAPAMTKAMESKNMAYFDKVCTPDFTYKEANGKVTNKKESLSGMQGMMNTMQKIKFKAKIGAFKSTKAGMTVDVLNTFNLTTKPGQDKKTHVMTMQSKSRETWVKSGGKWLLKNITDLAPAKSTMDGKPMPAGMGG